MCVEWRMRAALAAKEQLDGDDGENGENGENGGNGDSCCTTLAGEDDALGGGRCGGGRCGAGAEGKSPLHFALSMIRSSYSHCMPRLEQLAQCGCFSSHCRCQNHHRRGGGAERTGQPSSRLSAKSAKPKKKGKCEMEETPRKKRGKAGERQETPPRKRDQNQSLEGEGSSARTISQKYNVP